jgi:IrrE N-terminal-like domain
MSAGHTRERIKSLAFLLRKELGFENVQQLDMLPVLAAFKKLYPSFDYVRVDKIRVGTHEVPEAEGMYDPETRVLAIPDPVFDDLENWRPRARFSIAHELAHPILQHASIRFRRAERKAYERATADIRREEREADQFAAFFLAPDHLADGCVTVQDFMKRFGLSRRAAEIRKDEYERDLRHKKGEQRPLPPNVIDFLDFQRSRGYRVTPSNTDSRQRDQVGRSELPTRNSSTPSQGGEPAKRELRSRSSAVPSAHYISERCTTCREPTLFPLDCKYKCDTCGTVIDRFQDGDMVDP